MQFTPSAVASSPADAPASGPLFGTPNGSSWVVAGRRVRWSVAKDGLSMRAHSPVDVRSGKRVGGHNVVKVSMTGPVAENRTLTTALVNVALAFAMATPQLRTVKLEETEDGIFAVSISTLGAYRPVPVAGSDVRRLRQVLDQFASVEAALARFQRGATTPADRSLLRQHYPHLFSGR